MKHNSRYARARLDRLIAIWVLLYAYTILISTRNVVFCTPSLFSSSSSSETEIFCYSDSFAGIVRMEVEHSKEDESSSVTIKILMQGKVGNEDNLFSFFAAANLQIRIVL